MMNNRLGLLMLVVLSLLLTACLHTGEYTGPYVDGSPKVLVQPSHRVWLKPGSTVEDETQAMHECSDELQRNEKLRKESARFNEEVRQGLRKRPSKKNRDPWSAAGHACMQRKGFKHYEDP